MYHCDLTRGQTIELKIRPTDVGLERRVVGCLLRDWKHCACRDMLSEDMFENRDCRELFHIMSIIDRGDGRVCVSAVKKVLSGTVLGVDPEVLAAGSGPVDSFRYFVGAMRTRYLGVLLFRLAGFIGENIPGGVDGACFREELRKCFARVEEAFRLDEEYVEKKPAKLWKFLVNGAERYMVYPSVSGEEFGYVLVGGNPVDERVMTAKGFRVEFVEDSENPVLKLF